MVQDQGNFALDCNIVSKLMHRIRTLWGHVNMHLSYQSSKHLLYAV